jgi:hypothetical protein
MVEWLAHIEAKDVAVPLASFAAGLLLALLLLSLRYRLRLRELDLPFLKVDLSRLEDLSPVKLFSTLTRVALQPQPAPETLEDEPLVAIHAGWTMVCDAFIERFRKYPDEPNVKAVADQLGGQNVEFVLLFQKIHDAAMKHEKQVKPSFARDYVGRAVALAERIGKGELPKGIIGQTLQQAAIRHRPKRPA